MSWEGILKYNPTGVNSIIDLIGDMRDVLTEMETITKESFPASTDEPIKEFDTADAIRLGQDYVKIQRLIKVYWFSMIKQGGMA